MILNRVRPAVEAFLRINQNGFRPGRTATSQILALCRIIEGVKDKKLPAILVFIVFKRGMAKDLKCSIGSIGSMVQ